MSQAPDFDSIKQVNPYGEDYWSARALMPLLGYGKNWQNFTTAIQKAMISCRENGQIVEYHFNAGIKMVPIGSGAERPLDDYNLSRLACYLIAMNGNPRKPEIAHAQNYFAISTRAHEIHQLRMEQEQRLETRLKVSETIALQSQDAPADSSRGVRR
jgi:DNA-damage-inducible protein D